MAVAGAEFDSYMEFNSCLSGNSNLNFFKCKSCAGMAIGMVFKNSLTRVCVFIPQTSKLGSKLVFEVNSVDSW